MASQKLQFMTTDVFTQKRYEGNPLAIVRVPASVTLTQAQKQHMAKEFNLSETVILHESEESYRTSEWKVDIFITTAEIPFAGHPVIGTICYLGRSLQATGAGGTIEGGLRCKAGRIPFTYDTAVKAATAAIPHDSHLHGGSLSSQELERYNIPDTVTKAMPNPPAFLSIVKGMTFCLIEVSSLDALGSVRPNLSAIEPEGLNKEYFANGIVGCFFFCIQDEGEDKTSVRTRNVRTRMLLETLEDPATGSASSALAVYLTLHHPKSKQEGGRLVRKYEFTQGVEMGRKSVIGVEVTTDESGQKVDKVVLSGSAVDIMEGSINLPE
jgi:PhzF family phenazine biosynthesis protein